MALLKLDENTMLLNAIVGVQEEYKPTERANALSVRVLDLKSKMTKFQQEQQEFLKKEVMPLMADIRKEIQDINEERYPELKKMREDKGGKKTEEVSAENVQK